MMHNSSEDGGTYSFRRYISYIVKEGQTAHLVKKAKSKGIVLA
jgi:hypothetical protein